MSDEKQAAKPDTKPDTHTVQVRTRKQERRMRAGLVFGLQDQTVQVTTAQLEALWADPELVVTPTD